MGATQFLRDDHKTIRGLFLQLEAAEERNPEMREGVKNQLCMELEVHSILENEIYYPALGSDSKADPATLEEARDAHLQIDKLVRALRRTSVHAGSFSARLTELRDTVEEHVAEEEALLFAQKLPENSDLEERLRSRKRELLSRPEYEASMPQQVQNPHGGEQKRKDSSAA